MRTNFNNISAYFILSILFLFSASCSDKGTPPDEAEFILPDKDLSFYEHIEPMFQAKCGFESGCHSSGDLQSKFLYVELVDKIALMNHTLSSTGERLVNLNIHRTNPELAPLYLILKEGYPDVPNDLMPPFYQNRAPLTDNQISGIKQWIKEGAKD